MDEKINTYAQDVNLTEPYHHILKFQQPRHLSLLQICATCQCKKKTELLKVASVQFSALQ